MVKYIVDGHNTINSIPDYIYILEKNYPNCLERIIDDCENYSLKKKIKIHLIFDGNQPFQIPQTNKDLNIFFSGNQKDADTIIIEKAKSMKNAIIITNDKDLRRQIVSFGCKYLSPGEFYDLIISKNKKTYKSNELNAKKTGLSIQEANWWKKEMLKEINKKEKK